MVWVVRAVLGLKKSTSVVHVLKLSLMTPKVEELMSEGVPTVLVAPQADHLASRAV